MNIYQKLLLISATICYALTICGFLISSSWLTLLFFILHSILLLCFSYSIWHTGHAPQNAEMEVPVSEPSEEYKLALKQLETLKEENALLTESLSNAQKNSSEADTIYTSTKVEYDFLLPPTSSDNTEAIDIIQTAKEVIDELNSFARKAGIHVQISSATDSIYVKADKNRIRILFRNIIDNSIKYMNRSGNLIITMSILGDDIFIVLKDNGNGLDESETPHIFELNYQGSNRISGNGLGLTQAKAIVNSYGGTIYAKSTANNGMGIYIQMPIE